MDLNKELEEVGCTVVQSHTLKRGHKFGVLVEIKFPSHVNMSSMENLAIEKKTKRDTSIYAEGFKCNDDGLLSFEVWSIPPESLYRFMIPNDPKVATTFPDFCWTLSHGTTAYTEIEVNTKIDSRAEKGDLTWILPSKFCDDFIEIMHALNLTVLEGAMQDAVIYGPFLP